MSIKALIFFYISTLLLSCKKDDSDGFHKAFQNTFTCKVDGQHWEPIRYLPWNPAGYNTITSITLANNGYKEKGEYGLLGITGVKNPNPDDPIEKNYHSLQKITFATNADKHYKNIPNSWDISSNKNDVNVLFTNGFYHKNDIKEYDEIANIEDLMHFSNIIEGELHLDSIITWGYQNMIDLEHGGKDEVWGRFWFTAANKVGDTIRITEGQFHLQEL